MKKSNVAYFIICAFIIISGCAKDGATGPAGSPGQNGTNGANGTNGTDGADGNANVHSKNFKVSSWTWKQYDNYYYVWITDSDLTQNILDSGTVVVYYSPDKTYWRTMPFTDHPNGTLVFWNVDYSLNYLGISYSREDYAQILPSPSTVYFKVIITTSAMRIANPYLNWDNYEVVKTRFNLSD